MISRKFLFLVSSLIISACFATCMQAQILNYHEEKAFYEKQCNKCHEMKWYLWGRSYKSWELTVENMRTYMYDDAYTKAEGKRIARFLAKYAGENEILTPEALGESDVYYNEETQEEVPDVPDIPPEPVPNEGYVEQTPPETSTVAPDTHDAPETPDAPEISAPAEQKPMPPLARPRSRRFWNPSRSALKGARVSGFLAVAFLCALIASGFGRRKLKRNFRNVHIAMALGLFISLSVHGIIYIFKYGTPSVTWYWFGLIGFVALVITQLQGIVRKKFRKGLLISHIIGACAGLVLSILHWIWAWI